MRLAIMGPPGSGKGTQSTRLCSKLGLAHISTGDLLRKAVKEKTPLGIEAKKFLDKGQLVADEVVVKIVRERIHQPDCKPGFILDGFPRTIPQAKMLDEMGQDSKTKSQPFLENVLFFDISEEECVRRLANRKTCLECGMTFNPVTHPPKKAGYCDKCNAPLVLRNDDKPETVRERFKVYYNATEPLIDYYSKQHRLIRIDASTEPDKVFENALESVKSGTTL